MTIEDQFTAIRDPAFFTAVKSKIKSAYSSMTSAGMSVNGSFKLTVSNIPVVVTSSTADSSVEAGDDGKGNPLYTWKFPTAWLTA